MFRLRDETRVTKVVSIYFTYNRGMKSKDNFNKF